VSINVTIHVLNETQVLGELWLSSLLINLASIPKVVLFPKNALINIDISVC